jgi:hypothetical protein
MLQAQGRALAIAALTLCGVANANDQTFNSYARDLRTGRLLYVESHFVSKPLQPDEARVVLYRCAADGPAFARKELSYGATREEPQFTFVDARSGYSEGLQRAGTALQVFQREGRGSPLRQASVPRDIVVVSDAGFDEFVRKHWNDLETGKSVKFPFLVPSRLDYLSFRISKHGESIVEGAPVSVIRLNLSGFLGWFLPYIEVQYRKSDRVLMRYKGLTNVRDDRGDNHTAQIDFPARERQSATVDLARLRAVPLVARCP